MTSYIVRFFSSVPERFRGTVRHVRTGEESAFSSPAELLCFFERVNATDVIDPAEAGADRGIPPIRGARPWPDSRGPA
jgi:hypothetical protein